MKLLILTVLIFTASNVVNGISNTLPEKESVQTESTANKLLLQNEKKSMVPGDDIWQAININNDTTSIVFYMMGYNDGYYDENSLLFNGIDIAMVDNKASRAYFRAKRIGKIDRKNNVPSYF